MKKGSNRLSIFLVLLLVAIVLVAGCSKPAPTTTPAPKPSPAPTTSAPTAKPSPTTAPTTAAPAAVKLVASSYEPRGTGTIYHMEALTNFIDKSTGGRVKFDWRFGGELASATESYAYLGKGVFDFTGTLLSYTPDKFPLNMGFGLLYFTDYPDTWIKSYRDMYSQWEPLRKEYEAMNIRLISPIPTSPPMAITRKPVASLADFKGLRMRSSGYQERVITALGGVPVNIAYAELYESLQRGVLDGAINDVNTVMSGKFYEVAPNLTDISAGLAFAYTSAINLDTWKKLPADLQNAIDQAVTQWWAGEGAVLFENRQLEGTRNAIASKVARGTLTPAEVKSVKDQVVPKLWNDWAADLDKKGQPGSDFIKRYQDALAKYPASTSKISTPGAAFDKVK